MTGCLFAYGTLMYPALAEAIVGRVLPSEPAVLRGFRREGMQGRAYPAIVAESGGRVEGRLYGGIPLAALARLDRFEGDEYRRETHRVEVAGGRFRTAWCYVIAAGCVDLLSGRRWDVAAFERRYLDSYIGEYSSRYVRQNSSHYTDG